MQRIIRQRDTFAYHLAAPEMGEAIRTAPAAKAQNNINALPSGHSTKPYDVPEREGPRTQKIKIEPAFNSGPSAGTNGGGASTGRPSGSGGSGSVGSNGIMDISKPLADLIRARAPGVTIGGYRDDGPGRPDEHQRGSIDIMHPYDHGLDPDWVIQEGFKAGAPWSIWENKMYYPDGSTKPYTINPGMPNNATQRHEDHIHIGPLMN